MRLRRVRLEHPLTATGSQVCAGYLEDDQEEVLLLALGRLHLLLQPLDLLLQLAFLVLAGLVHVLVVAAVPLSRQRASPHGRRGSANGLFRQGFKTFILIAEATQWFCFYPLVLLFLQLVFGSFQLLLDLLHVLVHLADGGVQDLPDEESGRGGGA